MLKKDDSAAQGNQRVLRQLTALTLAVSKPGLHRTAKGHVWIRDIGSNNGSEQPRDQEEAQLIKELNTL